MRHREVLGQKKNPLTLLEKIENQRNYYLLSVAAGVLWVCEEEVEQYGAAEIEEEHCNDLAERRNYFWVKGRFLA